VLFSEPKIPQRRRHRIRPSTRTEFQCSSASRKFLKRPSPRPNGVLPPRFSALQRAENSSTVASTTSSGSGSGGFSALQRAENSSTIDYLWNAIFGAMFQCSSASRKFLKPHPAPFVNTQFRFQCSSASRKFLNQELDAEFLDDGGGFSALQRAENSSMSVIRGLFEAGTGFSALQRAENSSRI